jgi:signal transduction histidine kinase/ligand-binding sensor domain-containing protein
MTCRLRTRILVALWAACVIVSVRPALAVAPDARVTQLIVDSWTINEGLPQDRVQAIAQTADGLLWVGTEAGLARFDGYRFVSYTHPLLPDFRNESITALRGTPSGTLWVGTESGWLVRLDHGQPLIVTRPTDRDATAVYDIFERAPGSLLVAGRSGVLRVEGDHVVHVAKDPAPMFSIARTHDGTIWVGGRRGLFQLVNDTLQSVGPTAGYQWGRVNSLRVGPDGSLWAGLRSEGIARLHAGRWEHYLNGDSVIGKLVRSIALDADGHVWAGTWSGLARLENGKLSPWATALGRMPTAVDTVFVDRDDSLWVGTMGGGLYRIRQGAAITHTTTEGLTRDDLLAVCVDRQSRTWVGVGESGVNVLDHGAWVVPRQPSGLTNNPLWSCAVGGDGTVWLASGAGLFRARYPAIEEVRLKGFETLTEYLSLAATRTHGVWAVAEDHVLRNIDTHPERVVLPKDVGSIDLVLGESRDGAVWLSNADGLWVWREGHVAPVWSAHDRSGKPVSFLEAGDGTVWIGTLAAGLLRIRGSEITNFGRAAGLTDLSIAGIIDDSSGFLWLATHSGLIRVEYARLDRGSATDPLDPLLYTVRDGLRSHYTDERAQPSATKGPNGHLWFSTTRGVVELDPAILPTKPTPTGVFVDDSSVDGESLADGRAFGPGTGRLVFRYSAAHRISSPHVQFRYRLEGFDHEWSYAGSRRQASYTNVGPGTYRFVVGAADETSAWGPDEAAVSFVLLPHWYQTWWFRGTSVGLLLLTAATLPLMRARRLRHAASALTVTVEARTAELRSEIRERQMAEDALRDSESRYRNLAERLDQRVRERTSALEAEVRQHKQTETQLILTRDAAEAATRAKSAFLANMSHEFRTPLNAIIGYSEMLLEDAAQEGRPEVEADLSKIRTAGQHLLALVSDVLDMARIEADSVKLVPETVALDVLLAEVRESLTPVARHNGNVLQVAEGPELGTMVVDPLRLKQVLLNLMSNACKFTQNGNITLNVAREAEYGRTWTRFTVIDTGIGIAPEDLPKLFLEFSQVMSPQRRRLQGAGLGLVISRRLCTLMGGTIAVESQLGHGTTFTVRLPAEQVSDSSQDD